MDQSNNLIEKKCFQLLEKAISEDASDIHFVPGNEDYQITFRKNFAFYTVGSFPHQLAGRMISFYKFLSSLDISDQRKPQSGSFHKAFNEENYSFRVSTIPSIQLKESVAIRIQKHDRIISLDQLCADPKHAKQLRHAVRHEQGLFLVTGPTGTGKTTTLYSLTAHCVNELQRHVITLEDPVENNHRHLLQIQVNERSGITYAAGLKAILRHSPDVIMIGEIRDRETAKIAVEASLTGHLVLTTVHSKDPVGCFYRLMDLGISYEDLRQTIIAISAQKLVQVSDGDLSAAFTILQGEQLEEEAAAIRSGRGIPQHKPHFLRNRVTSNE